jgi:hypothetical protein
LSFIDKNSYLEKHPEEGEIEVGAVKIHDSKPYYYTNMNGLKEGWYEVPYTGELSNDYYGLINAYLSKLRTFPEFKTGGLADFTGPAWLDGTKARPEYILNSDQTERFFSLVDILEGFDSKGDTTEKGGDNYFDIKINVDKLENDYDIEQMANKIRRMIADDATYRNVNAINLIR